MIKAVYNRKHLTRGLLTVSESKSVNIMAGNIAADRHSTGAVAENLRLITSKCEGGKGEKETERESGPCMSF